MKLKFHLFSRFTAAFQNVQTRRKWLAILSGGLILIGLGAGRLFGLETVRYSSLFAAAVVAGADIAVRAFRSLRNRHISIELLVTIAAAGALWLGEVWEAAAVTFLFIFGAYLEARTLSQTRRVLGDLLDLAPMVATVIREGRPVEVAAYEVQVDETVLVKAGERCRSTVK